MVVGEERERTPFPEKVGRARLGVLLSSLLCPSPASLSSLSLPWMEKFQRKPLEGRNASEGGAALQKDL